MTLRANSCNSLQLELLLGDEAGGESLHSLTDHVESCVACQARLAELAGGSTWWTEARESLSSCAEYPWSPDASWSSGFVPRRAGANESRDSLVRKFLAPASHPELLGRLGRYDIERVIGAGGMGIVLKAHDSELNRPIAV
jgi:hypothetical protein